MSIQTTNPTADVTDRSTRQLGEVSITDSYQDEYLPLILNEVKRAVLLVEEINDNLDLPFYSGVLYLNRTPDKLAEKGVVNLGDGGFYGTGVAFVGSTAGTYLAVNALSTFTGNFIDLQLAGVDKFSLDFTGTILRYAGALPTNGQVLIGNGSGFVAATLTQGANVTITNGAGTITIAASSGASSALWTAKTTTPYTLLTTDTYLLADATAGNLTWTLPTAVGATQTYVIKKKDVSGANSVTINTTSSQTIDGALTYVLYGVYQSVTLVSDNANWWIA